MLPRLLTPLLALGLCADAQLPAPDPAETAAIVARMRAAALSYGGQLQDFICRQTIARSVDSAGHGRYKPLETRETELTYVNHKEDSRLLKVNGQTTNLDKRVKRGYFRPGGEFGSKLQQIFDPKANAEFQWDHGETHDGTRTCVFRYDIPVSTTTLGMHVDFADYKLGHHGLVYADCDSGAVTRFRMISDVRTIPFKGRTIQIGSDAEVRYGLVPIGSKEFLLPLDVEEVARFHTTMTRVVIHFDQYRKYDSASTVTFDKQ